MAAEKCIKSASLDYDYLTEWGEHLSLFDALSQALTEAGIL